MERKSILLIAPRFFNYENEIKKELENQGMSVEYLDERFNNSFLSKVLIRLKINLLKNYFSNRYYNKIFQKIENEKYDYILFISPETITIKAIEKLKKNCNNSKFILYMWDSFRNRPEAIQLLKYFDKKYSFDKEDCKKYNLEFLPLFYIDKYKNSFNKKKDYLKYKISFIGTAHEDRAKIVEKIKNEFKGYPTFFYLYLASKKIYWFRKIFDKRLKNLKIENFKFKPLNHEEIVEITNNSEIILDIEREVQTGLTMRTIEIALGMRKKLVTTNAKVKEYDFYNKNNIFVIDRKNPKITEEFINNDYERISEKIYNDYSLKSWIKKVIL